MEEFKVGDKVFDLRYGNGVVEGINKNEDVFYPIQVNYENKELNSSFTKFGFLQMSHNLPLLYHGHDLVVLAKEPNAISQYVNIDEVVSRFLSWDAKPIGTNLLNAQQAKAMIEHILNIEPEYEWQWIYRNVDAQFAITRDFYKNKSDAQHAYISTSKIIEAYEPSKRPVK